MLASLDGQVSAGSEVLLLTNASLPAVALMLKVPLALAAGKATPTLPPLPNCTR